MAESQDTPYDIAGDWPDDVEFPKLTWRGLLRRIRDTIVPHRHIPDDGIV